MTRSDRARTRPRHRGARAHRREGCRTGWSGRSVPAASRNRTRPSQGHRAPGPRRLVDRVDDPRSGQPVLAGDREWLVPGARLGDRVEQRDVRARLRGLDRLLAMSVATAGGCRGRACRRAATSRASPSVPATRSAFVRRSDASVTLQCAAMDARTSLSNRRIAKAVSSTGPPSTTVDVRAVTSTTSADRRNRSRSTTWLPPSMKGPPPDIAGSRRQHPARTRDPTGVVGAGGGHASRSLRRR